MPTPVGMVLLPLFVLRFRKDLLQAALERDLPVQSGVHVRVVSEPGRIPGRFPGFAPRLDLFGQQFAYLALLGIRKVKDQRHPLALQRGQFRCGKVLHSVTALFTTMWLLRQRRKTGQHQAGQNQSSHTIRLKGLLYLLESLKSEGFKASDDFVIRLTTGQVRSLKDAGFGRGLLNVICGYNGVLCCFGLFVSLDIVVGEGAHNKSGQVHQAFQFIGLHDSGV